MRIEPAKISDLRALHLLIESAYRGDSARRGWTHEADLLGGQRTDIPALRSMMADPAQSILVARDGDRLAGCIALARKANGLAYIGLVTVDPSIQAQGLGRALLAAGERYAVDRLEATQAEMTVIAGRQELIAWYERRGYRLTGERRPFPMHDPRFGLPKQGEMEFVVLEKPL